MEHGLEIYDIWTNIEYDFNSDTIYSICEKVGNRWVSVTASQDYKTAPWGVADVSENKFLQMPSGGCIIIGISGRIRNNIFQNIAVVIGNLSGVVENNLINGSGGYFYSALNGGNVAENTFHNSIVKIQNTAGGDDITGNITNGIIFSVQTPGVDVTDCSIIGNPLWGDIEFVSNASALSIDVIQSSRENSIAVAANTLTLDGAPEYAGTGIFEVSNTATLDTISNSSNVPDTIVIKPAAGTILTIDPGTSTNISIASAIPVLLDGNNEDFCTLRRGAAGTNWLVEQFVNY
jgi:hypothetical protein